MHELSFTLKFLSAIYAWPLPEATSTTVVIEICIWLVGNLPSMICSKQGVSWQSTFSCLNSDPGNQRCTLVSSLQASPTELDLCNIKIHMCSLKFTVYGCKQASKHTHAHAQCSHASVGLAQAHPNYCTCSRGILSYFHIHSPKTTVPMLSPCLLCRDISSETSLCHSHLPT